MIDEHVDRLFEDLHYKPPEMWRECIKNRMEEAVADNVQSFRDAVRQSFTQMSCGHQLRHWSPLEGTAAGAILFRRDPEKHGFCELCRATDKAVGTGGQAREDAVFARGYRKGFFDARGATAFQSEVDAAHERWVADGRKTHLDLDLVSVLEPENNHEPS